MRTASTAAAAEPATASVYLPRATPVSPLRMRRLRAGVRLITLSVETGISIGTLSNVERGVRPITTTEAKTIADAVRRIVARSRQ